MAVYLSARVKVAPDHPPLTRARFRGWRALFPMKATMDLLRAAYVRVDRLNTPPAGESFYLDGKPYATETEFVDDLVDEFRAQLHRYLARSELVTGDQSPTPSRQARPSAPVANVGRALALSLLKGGASKKGN